MKKTAKHFIMGIAAALGFALVAAAPAEAALNWTTTSTQNGVTCTVSGGETTYPGNGHIYYCDSQVNDRTAVYSKLNLDTTLVRTTLDNANVRIYVWHNWTAYKQYFNVTGPVVAGASDSEVYGFTKPIGTVRNVHVIRYQDSPPLEVSVTANLLGVMMHEVGHQLDVLQLPPAGNLYNSQLNANSIYYQKLMKDKAKINTYIPCNSLFRYDYYVDTSGNSQPVCPSGALNTALQGKTNWEIMTLAFPYVMTPGTNGSGITYYGELYADMVSAVTSNGADPVFANYLRNDAFACSRNYVNGMRNNGVPPANTSYQSWCN